MPRDFLSDDSVSPVTENPTARDFLQEDQPKESLGTSLTLAIPRIGEDIIKGGYNFLTKVPDYFKTTKTEVPGIFKTLKSNPIHALGQGVAGLAELGQNLFNTPYDIANYASNRLNFLPQNINKKIQMARMPDSSQEINNTFGNPIYPGEKLIRGIARNALNTYGATKAASLLNPMNLTAKSIANDILKTEKRQVNIHSKEYNKIWNEADKSGFNNVPVDAKKLSDNLSIIEKYKTPKDYQSLEDFIINPSLANAQKAQSDMGIIHRKLQEKSSNGALTSEEISVYNAAKEAEKHIESKMFYNKSGNTNQSLKDKYTKLTNSYRENVVPYKYNSSIQAYKSRKMLPNELVNSLSRGEFAAKKSGAHPAIKIRNMLSPLLTGAGLVGGSAWLYNQIMGNQLPEEQK